LTKTHIPRIRFEKVKGGLTFTYFEKDQKKEEIDITNLTDE